MQNDPDKLKTALEQLEAERMRRGQERIDEGKAVGVIEFVEHEDAPLKPLGRDERGREKFRKMRVYTGVPRGDPTEHEPSPPKPRTEPNNDLARYGYDTPLQQQAPKPAPKFEPMKPRAFRVQTRAPRNDNDPGEVDWFAYQIDASGKMTVMDRSGSPIGYATVEPGGALATYDAVARRVVTKERGESSFWRSLN